jgi:hypothetical protein
MIISSSFYLVDFSIFFFSFFSILAFILSFFNIFSCFSLSSPFSLSFYPKKLLYHLNSSSLFKISDDFIPSSCIIYSISFFSSEFNEALLILSSSELSSFLSKFLSDATILPFGSSSTLTSLFSYPNLIP